MTLTLTIQPHQKSVFLEIFFKIEDFFLLPMGNKIFFKYKNFSKKNFFFANYKREFS